ncbi:MAG: hypothetical protein D6719_01370 [Candidatus Dadabacteria bacterium]|nr:MAG: hypothetical protein D6719_01370 [Candidatus Dadabacteria bacterium]
MSEITNIRLRQKRWKEGERKFVEPVLSVTRADESRVDYIFRWAKTGELLSLDKDLAVLIDKQFVWSAVRPSTIVERYVIQVKASGMEPLVFQSFRLFPQSETERLRPSQWMWNNGPLEEPFLSEKKAERPYAAKKWWDNGPGGNCIVLQGGDTFQDSRPPRRSGSSGRRPSSGRPRRQGGQAYSGRERDDRGGKPRSYGDRERRGDSRGGRAPFKRRPGRGSRNTTVVAVSKKKRGPRRGDS